MTWVVDAKRSWELTTRIRQDLGPLSEDPSAETARRKPRDTTSQGLDARFDDMIVDGDLRAATRSRFITEHYADAAESAVKMLNELVRSRTGRTEDGDELMTLAFSPNSPLLRVAPGTSKSALSVQRGHMQLCQGVVAAWRNPRAHAILSDDPERVLAMLVTVQELMTVTRAATRTRRRKG